MTGSFPAPEITEEQLRTLTWRAESVVATARRARERIRHLSSVSQRGLATGNLGAYHFDDDESADLIYLVPPWRVDWPESMYELAAAQRRPDLADVLAQLVEAAAPVPDLLADARHAAPGFLRRLFAAARTTRAREAAHRLSGLLEDLERRRLPAQVGKLLDDLDQAVNTQRRGVHLFPGAHGTPEHLMDQAHTVLRDTLGKHAGERRELALVPFRADDLVAVTARGRRLLADPNSEPALRKRAEALLDDLTAEHTRDFLGKLPVEALRAATAERVRTDGLDAVGVTSVADVLDAPEALLRQVPGIGERTAARIKAAARTMRREAAATHSTSIGERWSATAGQLVEALARFDAGDRFDDVERARRDRVLEYAGVMPAGVEGGWWAAAITGSQTTNGLWRRFTDDLAWAQAHPRLMEPVRLREVVADPWADYLARPAHYQGLLVTLLQREVEGGEDLDAPTLEAVRALQLDRTHLDEELHLRGYQSFGARFAVVRKKVILGDEMGLGKTVQALAAASHVVAARASELTRILVVCPAAVVVNWIREARSFTRGMPIYRAHGDGKEDAVGAWRGTGGICVVTYDGARTMDLGEPEFVVVDEAHQVKNPQAQRSVAVRALIDAADHAMLLSGTPLENRVEEFATLVGYVAPDLLSAGMETMNAADFRAHIAPAYLRRNQADVLDELPEKTEGIDWIDLHEADQAHYAAAVAGGNWMAVRRAPMTTPDAAPAKLGRIHEIVDEAHEAGRKVLVFSFFLDVLERLTHSLGGRVVGTLTGSVSPTGRQELVDKLAAAEPGAVLLAQINAGGTGLNIQSASVVILAEPQVKPSTEAQAVARVHRMGQTSTVMVHRLIAEDTAEEKLLAAVGRKTQIFDAYARRSDAAEVHDAVDVTEADLAAQIIAAERQRLGHAPEQ